MYLPIHYFSKVIKKLIEKKEEEMTEKLGSPGRSTRACLKNIKFWLFYPNQD